MVVVATPPLAPISQMPMRGLAMTFRGNSLRTGINIHSPLGRAASQLSPRPHGESTGPSGEADKLLKRTEYRNFDVIPETV